MRPGGAGLVRVEEAGRAREVLEGGECHGQVDGAAERVSPRRAGDPGVGGLGEHVFGKVRTAPDAATSVAACSAGPLGMLWAMADLDRTILLAPAPIARAAARFAPERAQRWMLCQPLEVRRSFAEEVLGQPDEARRREAWMLRQPDEVRLSYIREVLEATEG
jgi:hypothetical protein